MEKIIAIMIMMVLVFPAVSADVITPGYSPIPISNTITNYDDFPDYVFLAVGQGPMCNIEVIENGVINGQYKFCRIDVYVIEDSKFEEGLILTDEEGYITDEQLVKDYLSEVEAIKVLDDIEFYREVHVTSPIKEINNEYEIDLNKVLTEPTNSQGKDNPWFYVYIAIPIIALLIIVFILIRRKNVHN